MVCSEGLLYNPAKKACDFAERVTCAVCHDIHWVLSISRYKIVFVHSYPSVNKLIPLLTVPWPVLEDYHTTKIVANSTYVSMADHRNIRVLRVRCIIRKSYVAIVQKEQNVSLVEQINSIYKTHVNTWNSL